MLFVEGNLTIKMVVFEKVEGSKLIGKASILS